MRFAGCRLDLEARRLFRGTREVHLSPKAFELLKVLVESRPRAVSKAELLERVWPGIFVSEASLARAVNEIRDGLGDTARRGQVVRTVHGFGYAFGADIQNESAGPGDRLARGGVMCWLSSANREVALQDGDHVAGRDPAAGIWLDSPRISRHHARVLVSGASVIVEDLGSKNGTFVNGERIAAAVTLKRDDQIRIGPFRFVFRVEFAPPSTETDVNAL